MTDNENTILDLPVEVLMYNFGMIDMSSRVEDLDVGIRIRINETSSDIQYHVGAIINERVAFGKNHDKHINQIKICIEEYLRSKHNMKVDIRFNIKFIKVYYGATFLIEYFWMFLMDQSKIKLSKTIEGCLF